MTTHWFDAAAIPEYVPREEMPQVDEADLPALLHFAATRGLTVEHVSLPYDRLRVHQVVDRVLVQRITADPILLRKPCLVSQEPFLLDGNHRADAHRVIGTPVPAYMFPLPFAAAVKFLFHFPRTYSYAGGGHKREEN